MRKAQFDRQQIQKTASDVPKILFARVLVWKIQTPKGKLEQKIRKKMWIKNWINVENGGDLGVEAVAVMLRLSLKSRYVLGVGYSRKRNDRTVENYPPLGIISHLNRHLFGN